MKKRKQHKAPIREMVPDKKQFELFDIDKPHKYNHQAMNQCIITYKELSNEVLNKRMTMLYITFDLI